MKRDLHPPVAERIPHETVHHGEVLEDPYFWLREKENPQTIEYLEAENRFTESVMEPTVELQQRLYDEMVARIQETDESVPIRIDDYFYYSRTEKGKQYPILCRMQGSMDSDEQILLDENALAEGKDYLNVAAAELSPDHSLLAYAADTDGSEEYVIRIKDLTTGELLPDEIRRASTGLEWGEDGKTLYYTVLDATHRPYRCFRHRLGRPAEQDEIVLEETDERFYLSLGKTKSRTFIVLHLHSNITDEIHVLTADQPDAMPRCLFPRRDGIEYRLEHRDDRFYFLTNDEAVNFRLVSTPVDRTERDSWVDLLPHDETVRLESIEMFRNHLVLNHRAKGLRGLRVHAFVSGDWNELDFDDPVYAVYSTQDSEFKSPTVRFVYSSLITPRSIYDYDLESGARELLKRQPVLGGYDPTDYVCERIEATAPDGVRVPISLMHRKDFQYDGTTPAFLYGYGSYGISMDPVFDSTRFNLVDRGFVFAIAHIRGGGDLGRPWYEAGKLQRKRNTFTDFIACAEHLVERGYSAPSRLSIGGGSAGGLLMGAVLNMRPDLFGAVVSKVPFVDVLNTMSDPTLPLTVIEYEEWGNPADPAAYKTIRSYSPYDNVQRAAYPHMLIEGGLNDPRVSYWEPAKWTARLRTMRTDDRLLLLKTEMGSGHSGPSGRYDYLRELAFEQAFLLLALDLPRDGIGAKP